MSALRVTILLWVAAVFQGMLSRWTFVSGLSWPLLSATVLCLAFRHSRSVLIYSVILASLLNDSLMPIRLGASIPYFALVGVAVYLLRDEVFADHLLTYLLIGIAVGVFRSLYFGLFLGLFGLRDFSASDWGRFLLSGALLGAVTTPVVYGLLQVKWRHRKGRVAL